MIRSRFAARLVAALGLAGSAGTAFAAEPYVGRWNTSAKACREEALFTFTPKSVVGLTFACESTAFRKDPTGWAVHAKTCTSEDPDEKPSDMDFRVMSDGKTLRIDWLDGSKSETLVRCGR